MTEPTHPDVTTLTAQIVSAYVSGHLLDTTTLPGMIADVGRALADLRSGAETGSRGHLTAVSHRHETRSTPAVDPKASVFPSHIVCLECGAPWKMLKRHILTAHGLTPEQYRERRSLPASYPMVAPEYAAVRSGLAKGMGLGKGMGKAKSRGRAKKMAA